MSNTLELKVDEDVRTANSRAVRRRNDWRRKYEAVTAAIRDVKNSQDGFRNNRTYYVYLNALRREARFLMIRQAGIKHELRTTAYKWV